MEGPWPRSAEAERKGAQPVPRVLNTGTPSLLLSPQSLGCPRNSSVALTGRLLETRCPSWLGRGRCKASSLATGARLGRKCSQLPPHAKPLALASCLNRANLRFCPCVLCNLRSEDYKCKYIESKSKQGRRKQGRHCCLVNGG